MTDAELIDALLDRLADRMADRISARLGLREGKEDPAEAARLAEVARLETLLAAAKGGTPLPKAVPADIRARPRASTEAVLDAALTAPVVRLSNGLPAVNPNDTLVNDPSTGSVTRIPNGASQ